MKNRNIYWVVLPAAILLLTAFGFIWREKKMSSVMNLSSASSAKGFAVVELFTSEGCSSCPSADVAVARLLAQQKANVFVLGFHVDYWNQLGWTDPFSQAQFSDRQRQYAKAFKLESIYTPQVVVNGKLEFVGSDEVSMNKAVETALNKAGVADLSIQVEKNDKAITINYQTSQHGAVVNAALVQPEATTEVKRGENAGRTLHHVNVVKAFVSAEAHENGYLTFTAPNDESNEPLQLIIYTQQKGGGAITAVQQKTL